MHQKYSGEARSAAASSHAKQVNISHSGARKQPASPEPMHTALRKFPRATVFIGSRPAPLGHPGMTPTRGRNCFTRSSGGAPSPKECDSIAGPVPPVFCMRCTGPAIPPVTLGFPAPVPERHPNDRTMGYDFGYFGVVVRLGVIAVSPSASIVRLDGVRMGRDQGSGKTAKNMGLISLMPFASLMELCGNSSIRGHGGNCASWPPGKWTAGSLPLCIRGVASVIGSFRPGRLALTRDFDHGTENAAPGQ